MFSKSPIMMNATLYLQSELWKAYEESAFPKLVGLINKMLSGGKQWLVGDKVSLPDALLSRFSLLVGQMHSEKL